MSSLNDAVNFVLNQSEKAASIQLSSPSTQVTEQLERSKRIAGTKRKLIRDADASECKLFAVSTTEATRINTDAIQEVIARESLANRPNVERILSAAISLNEICHDPNSAAKIEDLRQVLEDQQINLDYLDTTYQKNRDEVERLTKLAAEMPSAGTEQQAESSIEKGKQPMLSPELQQQKELEELEKEIAAKKQELKEHQQEASKEIEMMDEERRQKEESKQDEEQKEPEQMEARDFISILRERLQEILTASSITWKEKFSEIRKELIRQILSENNDSSSEVSNEAKLMAKVIELLQSQESKELSLADLKAAAGTFATNLGLQENAGTQAIYKLGAHKIVHIDRSRKESTVQLL